MPKTTGSRYIGEGKPETISRPTLQEGWDKLSRQKQLALVDTTLTPPGAQHPATPCNRGNRKGLRYAGFANPCNTQKQLTAHSY
jgi:hypothetical protein